MKIIDLDDLEGHR